jgi:hypothetical protein
MVWQMMRWAAIEDENYADELDHEIMFVMRPELEIAKRKFELGPD